MLQRICFRLNLRLALWGIMLMLSCHSTLFAQNVVHYESLTSDSLFQLARHLAYTQKRDQARDICRWMLKHDSTSFDAAVLMGRTYAWDSKYDSARIVLESVLNRRPTYYDALDAIIDTDLYAEKYKSADHWSSLALKSFPADQSFVVKKAKALSNDGQNQEALNLLRDFIKIHPTSDQAQLQFEKIKTANLRNKVTAHYWIYAYDNDPSWQFASLAYGRQTKHLGSVILRYNYAYRFARSGHQIEVDAYPTLTKGVYLYLNAGISNKSNFPYSRIGIEPYFKLPASFELSIGTRYMNFDDHRILAFDSSKVFIYTGSVGKYIGNYWISLRPYFTPNKGAWSKSLNLTVRRYFATADDYLSLVVGLGSSPDEQQYAFDPVLRYLKSNKITLEYQKALGRRWIISSEAGYAREEIRVGNHRNRFSIDLGFNYRF